jgi:hypothetical protein
VPDASFTLLDGDMVRIDGGDLGVLENAVTLVGDAGSSLPAAPADPAGASHTSASR